MGLTVVIPACDRPVFLVRAIESVGLSCESKILVVDNSIDPLEYTISPYPNVDYVRTSPRIGASAARNFGARCCSSEYIAFLDDDDIWLPEYIKHSLSYAVENKSDVVVGQLMKKEGASGVKPYKLFPVSASSQRSVFFKNPGFGGQNILIKRDLFLSLGGYDESMPASEDRDLAARLLLSGIDIAVQPESIAVLINHDGIRARDSLIRGNFLFLKKHWQSMSYRERYLAAKTLLTRWFRYRKGRVT